MLILGCGVVSRAQGLVQREDFLETAVGGVFLLPVLSATTHASVLRGHWVRVILFLKLAVGFHQKLTTIFERLLGSRLPGFFL
ncbi:MAG: hypothetical protein ACYDBA_04320 [Sulfuricaulis sp.]